MAYKRNKIGADVEFSPDEARDQILAAFKASGANLTQTSKDLGINHVTLWRWINKLGLKQQIERIRKKALKEGWATIPDPGKPKKRETGAARRLAG